MPNRTDSLVILGFFVLIWGCDKSPKRASEGSLPSVKTPDSLSKEFSEIYSEVVNSDSSIPSEKSLIRVFGTYIQVDSLSLVSIQKDSGVDRETVINIWSNAQSMPIENIPFAFKTRHLFYFQNRGKSPTFEWAQGQSKQFQYVETIGFSKIGFNGKRNQALVYVEVGWTGHTFSAGYFKLLVKRSAKWKSERTLSWWAL